MIRKRIEKFSFDPAICRRVQDTNSFTLTMDLDFSKLTENGMIAEIPGSFTLKRRTATGTGVVPDYLYFLAEMKDDPTFDDAQHYLSYPMPDGSCPVIEATLFLKHERRADWTEIRVGFAQSVVTQEKHRLILHTDGVRLMIIVDDEMIDENYFLGKIVEGTGPLTTIGENVAWYAPALRPEITVTHKDEPIGIQYFSTFGISSWVGDVVTFSHNDTLHLFYLLDRRHHGAKFGTGGHFYGHLSSKDLVNWEEHQVIGQIDEQWESCGTGTPFFHNGKYYFAYGLHTGRYILPEESGGNMLRREGETTGKTTPHTYEELNGLYPHGMTYSVSDDCIHFEKSQKLTHFSENPSVYVMPDGTLRMYADGIWTADKVDGIWKCVTHDFPPHGRKTPLKHTLECPGYFEWGGYYYMFVGMSGMYASPTDDFKEYDDLAADGRDVYDGILVPMAMSYKNDRRLVAGWVFPFGSYMVIRELVQLENHQLGIKWCPELFPVVRAEKEFPTADGVLEDALNEDACYEFEIDGSNGGRLALHFNDEAEFLLDLDAKTAQYETQDNGKWFMPPLKTMRETVAGYGDSIEIFKEMPMPVKYKCHVFSRDFKLDKLRGTDGVFKLRIMVKRDSKLPGTILDTEIAGVRTMVSLRSGYLVSRIELATDGGITIRSIRRQTF